MCFYFLISRLSSRKVATDSIACTFFESSAGPEAAAAHLMAKRLADHELDRSRDHEGALAAERG
jgi:hypothetical protein